MANNTCLVAWTGAVTHNYPSHKIGTKCYCKKEVLTQEQLDAWEEAMDRAATRISCAD